MSKEKKKNKRRIHEFLLSEYFDSTPVYDVREVGNWVLVKSRDGNTGEWMVSIYTQETYQTHHSFAQKVLFQPGAEKEKRTYYNEDDELLNHFKSL